MRIKDAINVIKARPTGTPFSKLAIDYLNIRGEIIGEIIGWGFSLIWWSGNRHGTMLYIPITEEFEGWYFNVD